VANFGIGTLALLERLRMQRIPIAASIAAVAALLAADLLLPTRWSEGLRDVAFDLVLAADHRLRPAAKSVPSIPVVVVDIDRRSLEAIGPWPWPRSTIAALINAIAAAGPAAVAVDILFAEHDARCPAAFAGRPAAASAACEPGATAGPFTEGDKLLAQAAYRAPLILGFLLDPERGGSVPQVPLVTRGSPSFDGLWTATGAVVPPSLLIASASGLGAMSLPANSDGVCPAHPAPRGGGRIRAAGSRTGIDPGVARRVGISRAIGAADPGDGRLENSRYLRRASAFDAGRAPTARRTDDLRDRRSRGQD